MPLTPEEVQRARFASDELTVARLCEDVDHCLLVWLRGYPVEWKIPDSLDEDGPKVQAIIAVYRASGWSVRKKTSGDYSYSYLEFSPA
jgi:hypothetical protein